MRQLMNLIVSVGLICAGLYVLYEELFVSYSGIHRRYQPFGIGLILFGSGFVWLWWYSCRPDSPKAPHTGEEGHCFRTLCVNVSVAVHHAPPLPADSLPAAI